MSLFEFIENKSDQQPEAVTPSQDDQSKPPAQGRKKPRQQKKTRPEKQERRKPAHEAEVRLHFQVAFPWIMEHLAELLQAGWNRPTLFRRGIHAWPYGLWGAAWLSGWCKKDVQISIDRRSGAIKFTFSSGSGRQIIQAAYPPVAQKNIKKTDR